MFIAPRVGAHLRQNLYSGFMGLHVGSLGGNLADTRLRLGALLVTMLEPSDWSPFPHLRSPTSRNLIGSAAKAALLKSAPDAHPKRPKVPST